MVLPFHDSGRMDVALLAVQLTLKRVSETHAVYAGIINIGRKPRNPKERTLRRASDAYHFLSKRGSLLRTAPSQTTSL